MSILEWARRMKRGCAVTALALRHPGTPWYAKALGGLTLAYALSPIDLIPDVIPVLGHLDDLVLVPLGLWFTIRLIPAEVWAACEAEAERRALEPPPRRWLGLVLVVLAWLVFLVAGALAIRAMWF
ncbi:MAG: YkvA family protein [Planctomycetota bacterium]|nr:YkvA family protein [Planctomycetota bacterium]